MNKSLAALVCGLICLPITMVVGQESTEKPTFAASRTMTMGASVEGVNQATREVPLRGPEGNVREFVAANPENPRRSAVGDRVVITITESFGIMVERPGTE